ncbi:MAG TPA: YqgE/AlgH family protein [Candidatus Binatia bacterium]|nr:YqgE/AlgH family protein [Candidatus Binatia bacterium]
MGADGLAPTLLLAMPQLVDSNFARSVVLLCKHNEEGALGFVVNRPVNTTASELLSLDPPPAPGCALTVWEGGPVSPERGWLLCRNAPQDGDGFEVCDGIYMSSSQALLKRILAGDPRECEADRSRLILGYAGWGPGQLDAELTASSWLNIPVDVDLVFETPATDLWKSAFRILGVDPVSLTPAPGIH